MTMGLAGLVVVAAATATIQAAAPPPPPQLNRTAFAACLVLGGGATPKRTPDLPAIKAAFGLAADDGLLAYLAVYPGQREPLINTTIQQPAWEKFAPPFWPHGQYSQVVFIRVSSSMGPA